LRTSEDDRHGPPAGPGSLPARRLVASGTLFYPGATLYAIFAVPGSVLPMLGIAGVVPGLATPAGHAHEMLFGYALAVVAGNQAGAMSAGRLALAFGLWLAARFAFLAAPYELPAIALNIGFAAVLAHRLLPRLRSAVRRMRNATLPLVLSALCASAVALQLLPRDDVSSAGRRLPGVALVLFALLMLFMGGRIIAPAVAGQFRRQAGMPDARVQPRIEAALVASTTIAVLALSFADSPGAGTVASIALVAAGSIAAFRLLRWRLWALRGRPDLLCLAAGYAWLAAGLVLLGTAGAFGVPRTAALHVIAVGSLGTLTLNVMAMSWALRARQDPARAGLQVWGTLLLAAATLARVAAGSGVVEPRMLLVLASSCWSGAFALLLVLMVRLRVPRRPPR
jgi:uncharacterized protein involved in response to NO